MGGISWSSLPIEGSFAKVNCLDGGSFIALATYLHASASDDETFRMYNWAFHVHDIKTDRHILWDAGMSSNPEDYPPWVQKSMASVQAVGPRTLLVEQLARREVSSEQIDTVIFSHAHWDHCRPLKSSFPQAQILFGPGTKDFCSPGHFHDPDNVQWDGRFFDPDQATDPFEELNGPWVKLGAFEKAVDFFGTGSFWIMQAPGHMPGNLCALVRQARDQWILLGSDCCHSRSLLDGEHKIAVWMLPDGSTTSLHTDIPAAKDTMARIRIMESQLGCHVALAHDAQWILNGTDSVLMGMLDENMKETAKSSVREEKVI